jgi:predicted alpha/beta superfamily hydrolase
MSQKYPRTSLFNTEERTIMCSGLGREYHLSVLLPPGYAASAGSYPVVYLLDGDILFGLAANFTPFLHWGGPQEVIVVGISYDMESYDQWLKLREFDFKIPEVKDAPPDSHAHLFLEALAVDIIPFIEKNYRATPSDRSLYGFSSSGFFVLYALFTRPDLFRGYLCASGDLDIAWPYFINHDQPLAQRKSNSPIQLYLTMGELEENLAPYFDQFTSLFGSGKYPGLSLETEIFKGEIHGPEAAALTWLHGVRRVYPVLRDEHAG